MSAEEIFAPAAGRHVLFITTKNLDYLRNTQEIDALRRVAASVTVLGYRDRSYPARLAKLYLRLALLPPRRFDLVFVGFAPQLVLPLFGWKFRRREVWVDFSYPSTIPWSTTGSVSKPPACRQSSCAPPTGRPPPAAAG